MAFIGLIKRISRNNWKVRGYLQSRNLSNTNSFDGEDAKLPVLIVGAGPIFRKLDGLAEEIETSQPPVDLWRKFVYCTSLSGSTLGTVDHMQRQDFERVVSPVSVAHLSQYKLTNLLLKRLEDLGFDSKDSDGDLVIGRQILMGHECVAIDATKERVTATVSFLKGGKYTKRNIQCSILVGADGAGSAVRRLTGIEMRGERDLQKLVSVHQRAR